MESINYDKPCNKSSDCKSNVCELIYENGKPKGRYCLTNTDNKYTISCRSNKDCISGECTDIYDKNDKYVTSKCVKAPKIDKDTAYNSLFGADRDNEYGLVGGETIQLKVGKRGPITEIMIKVFSIIGNLFNIIVFNTDVCGTNRRIAKKKCKDGNRKLGPFNSCGKPRKSECSAFTERENHGLLYGIFFSIFDPLLNALLGNRKSLIAERLNKRYYNEQSGKCNKRFGAFSFDLWYIRTFITLLFPPIGVFMAKGMTGLLQVLICCVLTMMFYVPGLIYALIVINGSDIEIDSKKI